MLGKRDGGSVRKARIEDMRRRLKISLHLDAEMGASLEMTVAIFSLDMGITEKRVLEYLGTIERAGYIAMDLGGDTLKILNREAL